MPRNRACSPQRHRQDRDRRICPGAHRLGVEILSTGGTFRVLKEGGIAPLREVAEVTQFPEMLDGRVKTIHPRIAGGILAVRSKPEHMRAIAEHGIPRIDWSCVSLYEFEKIAAKKDASLEELIENIDIGGPTMIRAAAKNWQDVAVITSVADYAAIIEELTRGQADRFQTRLTGSWPRRHSPRRRPTIAPSALAWPKFLPPAIRCRRRSISARRARWRCATARIRTSRLRCTRPARAGSPEPSSCTARSFPTTIWWIWTRPGSWFCEFDAARIGDHQAHQSVRLRRRFDAGRKLSPGVRSRSGLGVRRRIGVQPDGRSAKPPRKSPRHSSKRSLPRIIQRDALNILTAKKNLRLLRVIVEPPTLVVKSISGGYLAQTPDAHVLVACETRVVTGRVPTEEEWIALEFGWKVSKHVKSNAIVYARAGQTHQRRRGPDEPCGFRQGRRDEGRAAASRVRSWLRTLFSRSPTASRKRPSMELPR